jgi:hypothetical protein
MNRLSPSSASPVRARNRRSGPLVAAIGMLAVATIAAPAAAQWGGFGYHRGGYASTAGQGAAYGMSEMMRAQGYENLQNSEAAKNWEDAKTLGIQNKMRWTETYFEMRKTNRDARASEAGPAITHDQAIRMAKMGAPPRLVSTQLDPVTGHIEYPMVLQDDVFTPYREELDKLFARRASSGGSISFGEFQEIQSTVSSFTEALKEHVDKYPAGEYGRARTFLDSLRHEASLPSG